MSSQRTYESRVRLLQISNSSYFLGICDCLEDGIRKLADGPFWQYIPDLDWNIVQKHLGSSAIFEHLVVTTADEATGQAIDTGESMENVVIELLDVDPSEFSVDVPFTAYGLDSLSAARLSFALRPYVSISQLQLLSDISLTDLQARIEQVETDHTIREKQSVVPSPEPSYRDIKLAEMESMVTKYTHSFPKHVSSGQLSADNEVVLITGTTGAIGASMLAQLADIPSVTRIYAFNRASSEGSLTLRERQALALRKRGYDAGILDRGVIVMVEGDQSRPDLGISPKLFQEVNIIHRYEVV
jgi:Male sterility protein/Phosphopantetheine attachment site